MIEALTSRAFSRDAFVKNLEHFYIAIEQAAETIGDFSEKQRFLNTVYERFFQGFCVKVADTHGIVYTPAAAGGLHGRQRRTRAARRVRHVACRTGRTHPRPIHGHGQLYRQPDAADSQSCPAAQVPRGIALQRADAPALLRRLDEHRARLLGGHRQPTRRSRGSASWTRSKRREKDAPRFDIFNEANTERVERQRKAPIKVIIANPPYNAGQVNENDNNKNRKYEDIDRRVRATYGADSKATLLRKLSDPYVKAIRFAADRIGEAGVVCYVNNDSFVAEKTFDGMRKHLAQDFDLIYVLELGGNVRKNPTLSGTTHNVFGIQVGVSINLFIRLPTKAGAKRRAKIHYHAVPVDWRREQKYDFLNKAGSIAGVKWRTLHPDDKHNWLTNKSDGEFAAFVPLGSKDYKARSNLGLPTIFRELFAGRVHQPRLRGLRLRRRATGEAR